MAGGEAKTERRTRADALRNRDKLIAVAAVVFADHGVEGSLEEIARRAGVGIGTLYRHFPTREHLVEVVYRRELQNLATAASDLAATRPADQALEEWMHRFVNYIAAKRGMAQSLRILLNSNSELFAEGSGIISGALRQLVDNAAIKGMIRNDVESTDLLHALSSIYSMPDSPEWRERTGRLIRLLMDGLKWGANKSG
ncbi:TetR family transcriptional regulator (plasmid) [Rhizobium sullae]|uniref:TetR family transcriptional regulator n=1 Tax=Rhizobium sullae TaxID=50338 RepID=A0A2N0DF70_RHISU|nr:TetR family transcriptional regulator [Rhizobium sullae]PKA44752.1 TetR family transcriptional regulator [Rhizobium sullae]UWU19075.1 TetR family transcriptional regulator [Rhizobium sullae]